MITSQKQYLAAKEKVSMLKAGLAQQKKPGVPEVLAAAHDGQVSELISDIESEITDYEVLKNAQPADIQINSIRAPDAVPVWYRIATGMSVEEFARKVEIHSRQIARYETEIYRNATTETLLKILSKLQLNLSGYLKVG